MLNAIAAPSSAFFIDGFILFFAPRFASISGKLDGIHTLCER
jgi:hypothetical protein